MFCWILILSAGGFALFLVVDRLLSRVRADAVDKAVIITGCDTGFGHATAKRLDSLGMRVFAGCLDAKGEGAKKLRETCTGRLHVVQLDVTSDSQLTDVVEYISTNLPKTGLQGLVNNAAIHAFADVELVPVDMYRRCFEVNTLGTIRVTKAFLPLLRQSKGRVINVSSVRGRVPTPYNSAYTITKYGIEAFSDTLRMEMRKWGVPVVMIEPGNFGGATGMLESSRIERMFGEMESKMTEELTSIYGPRPFANWYKAIQKEIPSACFDLGRVVKVMEDALLQRYPKPRYLVGGSSSRIDSWKVFVWVYPFVPVWLMDRIILRTRDELSLWPQALRSQHND